MTRAIRDDELSQQLGQYLEKRAREDKFSGAALLARDGRVLFAQAYGLASLRCLAPNRTDTRFNLGSMNKMFTGVAVVQLAERGRLRFEDTVGQHLPDYPNRPVAEKVTIHHLLTHTGGLGSYFNRQFMESAKERFRSVDDALPLMVGEPLLFEPGERWSYSNSGFLLLGKIIEAASGEDYFDYVRSHIYNPAGMLATDCYEMDDDNVTNLAMGYTRLGAPHGKRLNNIFLHSFKGGPAGGGFSTVFDLLKFDQALRSHVLLSAASTDTLWTGKTTVGPDPDTCYAYGFEDVRYNGVRVVGHGGGFPGINSRLDIFPDLGYTTAVMSNYDPLAAEAVTSFTRKLISGVPLPQPLPLESVDVQAVLGTYQALEAPVPDLRLHIRLEGRALYAGFIPPMGVFEILPLSEDEYCDEETTDRRLRLVRGPDGQVRGLETRDRREVMRFKKLN